MFWGRNKEQICIFIIKAVKNWTYFMENRYKISKPL